MRRHARRPFDPRRARRIFRAPRPRPGRRLPTSTRTRDLGTSPWPRTPAPLTRPSETPSTKRSASASAFSFTLDVCDRGGRPWRKEYLTSIPELKTKPGQQIPVRTDVYEILVINRENRFGIPDLAFDSAGANRHVPATGRAALVRVSDHGYGF